MRSIINRKQVISKHDTEIINITDEVKNAVAESPVENGIVFILSLHTTTGIFVNEGEPDVEADICAHFQKLVPEDAVYRHARFLPSDGQMAVNAVSHIRSALMGFQCFFPIEDHKMVIGGRQTIYLVELDGPQERNYVIQILGE